MASGLGCEIMRLLYRVRNATSHIQVPYMTGCFLFEWCNWWSDDMCGDVPPLWAARSLQRSLQTPSFVVLPHRPYLDCTHSLQIDLQGFTQGAGRSSAPRQIFIVSGTQRAVLSLWLYVGQCPGVEEEEDQRRLSSSYACKLRLGASDVAFLLSEGG